MKFIFKLTLKYYLKYITKLVLLIHRPVIIAVAGSTNKVFVKDEIKKVLLDKGLSVRVNPKNFNTEIGLPLAILNLPSGYNSFKNWLPIIFKAPLAIFQFDFPKYLVLGLGASDPGDMKYLLTIVQPKISIITDITQRYLEGFSDMDKLVGEYEKLADRTKKNGLIVLNYDNIRVRQIGRKNKKATEFFGSQNGAGWQAVKVERGEQGEIAKVSHNGIIKEYKLNRFGRHHVYSLLIGLIIKSSL
ncbi:hypothetical protein COV49_04085 [Candidatus Falkowbacteria bacterium CG11_big_fil_rev_8_21_14_0_20_39_10]|uniref:Mur ligase central domain-containing protein n=1 Tax=Candidatus Falkowbacteria bacterium CG11_big_fil_rev_8_21_14_0_20_39_10 TaxID=1974570 RepID=A0A2M6K829_9BACT|nr:MAG: hypothetical protein COV49_04085 [Candidatus Falkowbacteria bacterium CG11_big_fil_rev_8_21_14_0_20_39_10]